MDHINPGMVQGTFEKFKPEDDAPWLSARTGANGFFPRFQNLGPRPDRPFLGGYHAQMWSFVQETDEASDFDGFGRELKRRKLKKHRKWLGIFDGHGEMLPAHGNFCRLDRAVKDRWGIPVLHISCAYSENEMKLAKDMGESYREMLEVAGATSIEDQTGPVVPGDTIHESGTARMGHDPKQSFLNAFNQSHDVPNLFVTDGACLTSSGNQNPTLTLMALTLRACRFAAAELKAGRISVK
jgi:choline dehydrogenase-like flavoprotein